MGNCTASQRAVESWTDDGEWEEEEETSSEEGDHHHHHHHDHHHHERGDEHASEVTIRITKRQLHELMEKRGSSGHGLQLPGLLGSRRSTEQLLADIMNSGEVHHHREEHWHWKPALQSIPEAVES
ncbi:unnamed protein product [Urochloa humidicola]